MDHINHEIERAHQKIENLEKRKSTLEQCLKTGDYAYRLLCTFADPHIPHQKVGWFQSLDSLQNVLDAENMPFKIGDVGAVKLDFNICQCVIMVDTWDNYCGDVDIDVLPDNVSHYQRVNNN